jgi:hypothetical protein
VRGCLAPRERERSERERSERERGGGREGEREWSGGGCLAFANSTRARDTRVWGWGFGPPSGPARWF